MENTITKTMQEINFEEVISKLRRVASILEEAKLRQERQEDGDE